MTDDSNVVCVVCGILYAALSFIDAEDRKRSEDLANARDRINAAIKELNELRTKKKEVA